MHHEARQYVNRFGTADPVAVVEIGSLDINGTVRGCFPKASWHGIDVVDGPAVDEVADGAMWKPDTPVDFVICCEVFEHAKNWKAIVANMANIVKPGGVAVVTAAGPDRQPHSAVDGGALRPDEFYANIEPDDLRAAFESAGFVDVVIDVLGPDVRATATLGDKPKPKPTKRAAKATVSED